MSHSVIPSVERGCCYCSSLKDMETTLAFTPFLWLPWQILSWLPQVFRFRHLIYLLTTLHPIITPHLSLLWCKQPWRCQPLSLLSGATRNSGTPPPLGHFNLYHIAFWLLQLQDSCHPWATQCYFDLLFLCWFSITQIPKVDFHLLCKSRHYDQVF